MVLYSYCLKRFAHRLSEDISRAGITALKWTSVGTALNEKVQQSLTQFYNSRHSPSALAMSLIQLIRQKIRQVGKLLTKRQGQRTLL